MNIKKIVIFTISLTLASVLIIVLLASIFFELNPLWQSHDSLKRHLLKITPIGTSMEEAKVAIEKSFKLADSDIGVDMESGYKINDQGERYIDYLDKSYTIVGEKSIHFYLGSGGLSSSIGAKYAFDENDKLIEILVWSSTSLP